MFPGVLPRTGFARPRLVLSRCLDLEPCRYNAAVIESPFVRRLQPHVELVPVCPELEVGLGVPRAPIRLVRRSGATALVQPATGRDLTGAMTAFAERFLEALPDVEGFLLKARSPSCGVHGVKVFPDSASEAPEAREAGMFARVVLSRFPEHPAEHEGRLANPRLLDHFLTRLFALADVRRAREQGSVDALLDVHERHRLTRRTLLPEHAAPLEAIRTRAARAGTVSGADWRAYTGALRAALAPMPRESAHLAVLADLAAALRVPAAERRELDRLVASYREGTTPRWTVLEGLRRCCALERSERHAGDAYLSPYPEELALSP